MRIFMKRKRLARIAAAVFVLAAVLAVTGCAGKTKEATFGFTNGSVTLVPGEKFNPDAEGVGETVAYMEAASCYYDGLDKVFTYNGYEVTTYPAQDGDYIQDINISSDTIKTAEGVGVGSTLSQLEAAYGKEYTVSGKMYRFYEDDTKYMYFFLSDDVVKYYGYGIEVK